MGSLRQRGPGGRSDVKLAELWGPASNKVLLFVLVFVWIIRQRLAGQDRKRVAVAAQPYNLFVKNGACRAAEPFRDSGLVANRTS